MAFRAGPAVDAKMFTADSGPARTGSSAADTCRQIRTTWIRRKASRWISSILATRLVAPYTLSTPSTCKRAAGRSIAAANAANTRTPGCANSSEALHRKSSFFRHGRNRPTNPGDSG
jgi:hypothetical protein